jgi:Mor family transcriptional regulator
MQTFFSVFESQILNDLELTQKVVELQKKYALAPYFLRNF